MSILSKTHLETKFVKVTMRACMHGMWIIIVLLSKSAGPRNQGDEQS